MRNQTSTNINTSEVLTELGLFDLEKGIRMFRNFDARHIEAMEEFAAHSSGFPRHVANPLSDSRQHLARKLKERHLGDSPITIEIVHPDTPDKLVVRSVDKEPRSSPAVIRKYNTGEIRIFLSEAIFTAHFDSDPSINADMQVEVAGRLIGMLLALKKIDESPNSLGTRFTEWLSKDIELICRKGDDTPHSKTAQSSVMYGLSWRRLAAAMNPVKIDRFLSWEHIEKKISTPDAYQVSQEPLDGTKYLYDQITTDTPIEYWQMHKGRFKQRVDLLLGNRLEAVSTALVTLGLFGQMTEKDTVGQALILQCGNDPLGADGRGRLHSQCNPAVQRLVKAFDQLNKHPFSVPTTFHTEFADFTLSNLHQRFIQTVNEIATLNHVRGDHLCAMYLANSYVRTCHIDALSPSEQQAMMHKAYLFDAAAAERLGRSALAERIRYAAFSKCQREALTDIRDTLSGFIGLDMEAARKLERGLRSYFNSDTADSIFKKYLGFGVTSEVRLKGYLSLEEKLEELEVALQLELKSDKAPVAEEIFKDVRERIRRMKTGDLIERRAVCEAIVNRWSNILDEYPDSDIEKIIRETIDVTDCIGFRFSCEGIDKKTALTDSIEEILQDLIDSDELNVHNNLRITGIREIHENEVVNGGNPSRDKISQGVQAWSLRRYALQVTDSSSIESDSVGPKTWEIPIEVQLITKDELLSQDVGDEPRKYGLPHWWLKVARHASNMNLEMGREPDNEYCGPQLSFQDPKHNRKSFPDAFYAACSSVESTHLSVWDRTRTVQRELALPKGCTAQALLETMQYDLTQYSVIELHSERILDHKERLDSAREYTILSIGDRSTSYIPCTPIQILSRARLREKHNEQGVINLGVRALNALLHNSVRFDSAPHFEKLARCVDRYVAPYFGFESSYELICYLGVLEQMRRFPELNEGSISGRTAETFKWSATQKIEQLVGYHFEFPEAGIANSVNGIHIAVTMQRYHADFMQEVASRIPEKAIGVPHSVNAGIVSKTASGGVSVRLYLDMNRTQLEKFAATINSLAFPKGNESIIEGNSEVHIELWHQNRPGLFEKTIKAARSSGLRFIGFNMSNDLSGSHVPSVWTFVDPHHMGHEKNRLITSVDKLLGELSLEGLILLNIESIADVEPDSAGVVRTYHHA